MRSSILIALLVTAIAVAQDPSAPAIPVVTVAVAPLAPPDLNSPYASPRDGARHRLQATLSDLSTTRNIKEALRGLAEAFLTDRTYAVAAFDMGILATIAEKWDDSAGAFEEVVRIDPGGLGASAAPQLERVRMIAALERTVEGKRKRRYDEALLEILDRLPALPFSEANAALAGLGRVDPKRWEAPALLAGLNGDGRGYETADKFLEIAASNAPDPAIKSKLESALRAAEQELQYASTRSGADAAADLGDYGKAAELYQAAWTTVPSRVINGLDAASALLLCDDSPKASLLLARLRDSGDSNASGLAAAMLKELEPIEPAAKGPSSDASQFFHDPGPAEPVRIATLIPPVDRKPLELYARPLPKLVDDPEPVVLLASLAVEPSAADGRTLPPLAAPLIAGESPWRELAALSLKSAAPSAPRSLQIVDLAGNSVPARLLQVSSEPAGARIFISGAPDPTCEAPCNIRLAAGEYIVRLSLPGFEDVEQTVQVADEIQDLSVPLTLLRGNAIVETPAPATLKVNGTPLGTQSPAELSLAPGLYRIGADFGSTTSERFLLIKPGAHLRLRLHPYP
jgi:tetratricopeptide (TPR) repeat protein